jgi:hypothetical protein
MEDRRAAIVPNCPCYPRNAAVRVSVVVEGEVPTTVEDAGWVVIGGGDDDAPDEEFGDGFGGVVLDGAAEVLAMGSVKATNTKLLELELLRRWYEC